MKILLDECLPKRLKSFLTDFEVNTTEEMGWTSLENGNLIKAAIEKEFDILLTIDKNLEFQQNIKSYNITVVVFNVPRNKIDFISPLIPELKEKINTFEKGKVYYIK
jgi:hypothetical protein